MGNDVPNHSLSPQHVLPQRHGGVEIEEPGEEGLDARHDEGHIRRVDIGDEVAPPDLGNRRCGGGGQGLCVSLPWP